MRHILDVFFLITLTAILGALMGDYVDRNDVSLWVAYPMYILGGFSIGHIFGSLRR